MLPIKTTFQFYHIVLKHVVHAPHVKIQKERLKKRMHGKLVQTILPKAMLPVTTMKSQTRAETHVDVAPDSYYTKFEIGRRLEYKLLII